jgi:hypothetical protein
VIKPPAGSKPAGGYLVWLATFFDLRYDQKRGGKPAEKEFSNFSGGYLALVYRYTIIEENMPIIRRISLAFLLLILLIPASAVSAQTPVSPDYDRIDTPNDWHYVKWGIDWQKFKLTPPEYPRNIEIFVARLHRITESATVDTAIGLGTIAQGRETISGMAERYDNAINYWGYTEPVSNTWLQAWGGRNDVAVAINGYYFDRDGGTGVPWSGVVHSGSYDHRFTDNVGDAGFAWTHERQAFIGSCVYHTGNKNEATFERAGSYAPNIEAVNVPRDDEDVILYTAQYDSDTGTGPDALELLIELGSPSQILPKPVGNTGYIRRITTNQGSSPLYFDYVVLSFWGDARAALETRINSGLIGVGDRVNIFQEITDCLTVPTRDWTKTYASLGGDYHFLNNGVVRYDFSNNDANVPNSRTAIAYNADHVYFVVVDGFRPDSIGIAIGELGEFLRDHPSIQATDAVSLDSGTSSTMVINGVVVNNTYCNFTRDCGVLANPLLGKPPSETVLDPQLTYKTEWDNPTGLVEPLVGTAFLMVATQPISQSLTFTPTQHVSATLSTAIRLGPGTNYTSLGTVPAGETGKVIANLSQTNGVLAKNGAGLSYWWFVDMGDLTGWVPEEALAGGTTPPEPPPVAYTDFLFMPTIPRAALGVSAAEYGLSQSNSGAASRPLNIPGPNSR